MAPETEIVIQDLVGNLCEVKTESNDLLVVGRVESVAQTDQRVNVVSSQEDERLPVLA